MKKEMIRILLLDKNKTISEKRDVSIELSANLFISGGQNKWNFLICFHP